jgi:hypothetical protein
MPCVGSRGRRPTRGIYERVRTAPRDRRPPARAQAYRRHHSYITTAAAALALIERVEPYWVISM